jgi:hypothetical protein
MMSIFETPIAPAQDYGPRGIQRYLGPNTDNYKYQVTETAPGPFWVYCPSINIDRLDMRDGLDQIPACRVTIVENGGRWEDSRQVPTGTAHRVNTENVFFGGRNETLDTIYAGAILNSVLREYFHLGLVQVKAFNEKSPEVVRPDEFNALVYPKKCNYLIKREGTSEDYVLEDFDEGIRDTVEKMGVLRFRKQAIEEARNRLENDTRHPRREMYLEAMGEILKSYDVFESFATREINAVDNDIRTKFRSTYDNRDYIYQKLLARQPVDNAIERALSGQNGLTADHVRALVQEVVAANQVGSAQFDVDAIVKATASSVMAMLPPVLEQLKPRRRDKPPRSQNQTDHNEGE